jgi:hypothetical protein
MHWYVVHTKPRQEHRALLNLTQQGYECYLPLVDTEKLRQNVVKLVQEPLFSRYLLSAWTPAWLARVGAPSAPRSAFAAL